MSIAREPGRLRGDGRARKVGWAAGLALVVAAVLFVVTRMAIAPVPSKESAPLPGGAAVTIQAAGPGARAQAKPGVQVAKVEIQERRVPVRASRPPQPSPAAKPAVVKAEDMGVSPQLPSPPLRAPEKMALRPSAPAAAPPPVVAPKREVGQGYSPLEAEERPEARYPDSAAADGVTGMVRLKVVVDPRGQVADALVVRSSGDDRLDRAAEEAIRRWRYRPARRGGQAVTATDYVEVEFYRDTEQTPED